MSENEYQPPAPSKQTSSVPLKKETVRVTLKAADSPPAVPSSTVGMAPPVRPPVPTAPPIPTVGGAPRPPAPTIPLRNTGDGAAPMMAPAPTIRLVAGGSPPRPGGAPTVALPKATVQLQKPALALPTQPLNSLGFDAPAATVISGEEEEEAETHDGLVKILSIVGFVAALIVLSLQLMTANLY